MTVTRHVIGLSGYAGVGKDTVARICAARFRFERLAFADGVREALLAVDPIVALPSPDNLSRSHARLAEVVEAFGWEQAKREIPEVRRLQQRVGTDMGRDQLGEDVWVDRALTKLASLGERVVVTDVRFPNEAHALREIGAHVVRITRPGFGPLNGHVSEIALDGWKYDAVLDNDGTVADLEVAVGRLVEELLCLAPVIPLPLRHQAVGTP